MDIFYGGSSVLSWRQLRGRSCVTSGSFPATKSRMFPLRLVLLSSSAVRRRKDPDEQLAFHYEIQHWGRAGPRRQALISLCFSHGLALLAEGEMLPPSFTEQRQQQRRRCFSDGDVTRGGRRGGSVKHESGSCGAENFPLWVWFLQLPDGSIICFCAADVRLSGWEFSALQTLSASGELKEAHLLLVRVAACCSRWSPCHL